MKVLPFRTVPLMANSGLTEGETDTTGGIHDDEVEEGLSRWNDDRSIWDDEEEGSYGSHW